MHLTGNKAADAVVLKYSLIVYQGFIVYFDHSRYLTIFGLQNNDKSPNIYIYVLFQVLNSGFARCA